MKNYEWDERKRPANLLEKWQKIERNVKKVEGQDI